MIRKVYILLMISILTAPLYGQFVGRDNLSISLFYWQREELDSAHKYIDLAEVDTTLNTTAKYWFYKGVVYKDLYKTKEENNKRSPLRTEAIEAFKTMIPLDHKQEFVEGAKKTLKYLASTMYNDAVRSLTPSNYPLAIDNYNDYKKVMLLMDPSFDVKPNDVKFKLALASMLNKQIEVDDLDSTKTYQVKTLYLEILEIDSNNPGANYNLATLYYNEAADIINNMDYDMDLHKLNEVQDYCIEIFLKGLPYMLKAYQLNYKRKETLIGLSNIYYGLNDLDKSHQYKKELEDLEKE